MAQVNKHTPKGKDSTVYRGLEPDTQAEKVASPGASRAHPKSAPKLKKRREKLQEESPYKSSRPERILSKQAVEHLQDTRRKLMTQQPDPAGWKKWCALNHPPKRVVAVATTMLKYFPSEVHTIDVTQAIRFMQGMSEDRVEPLSENEAYQVLDAMVAKGTRFQSFASMRCARQVFDIVIEEGRERSLDRMHARLTEFVSAESATIALLSDARHADAFLTTLLLVVSKFDTRIDKTDPADVRRIKKEKIEREREQLQFVLSGLGRRATLTEPTLRGRKTAEEKQAKRRLTRSMETDSPTAIAWANRDDKKEKRKSMQFEGPISAMRQKDGAIKAAVASPAVVAPGKSRGIVLRSDRDTESLFADAKSPVSKLNFSVIDSPTGTAASPRQPPRSLQVSQAKPQQLAASAGDKEVTTKEDKAQPASPVKGQLASTTHRADSAASTPVAVGRQKKEGVQQLTPQEKLIKLLNDPTEAEQFVREFGQAAIGALRMVVVQKDDGNTPNYEVKIRKAKLEPEQRVALRQACKKMAADPGFELDSEVHNELLAALRAIGQDVARLYPEQRT